MNYFIDLEFIERGAAHPIDLISIGIVAEDGREYYAVNKGCKFWTASHWVWENVLRPMGVQKGPGEENVMIPIDPLIWKSREQIAIDILNFTSGVNEVKFIGEYCATDWVVFYQLWGALVHKPDNFPWRCRDVVHFLEDELGLSQDDWPESLETDGNHNALLGAKTVKARWEWCMEEKEHSRKMIAKFLNSV